MRAAAASSLGDLIRGAARLLERGCVADEWAISSKSIALSERRRNQVESQLVLQYISF